MKDRKRNNYLNIAFLVTTFVIILLSLISIFLITTFSKLNNDRSNFRDQETYTYKYLRYTPSTNISSRGITTIFDRLVFDDFLGYSDREDHYLISNFDSNEYMCHGLCYCNSENDDFRRNLAIGKTGQKSMMYMVAAISSVIAINIAKSHFSDYCGESFSDICEVSDIVSDVETCELVAASSPDERDRESEGIDHQDDFFKNIKCRGKCIDKSNYWSQRIDSKLKKAEYYEEYLGHKDIEIFPKTQEEFSQWLKDNYKEKNHVWIYMYKKHTGKKSANYDQCLEEAVCYGWVDSMINRIDDEVYRQVFSKRSEKGSVWSQTNLKRARKCIEEGKMTKQGYEVYNKWIKDNPEDENSHCEEHQFEKIMYDSISEIEGADIIKKMFMKDLDIFCKETSKEVKLRGGNGLKIKCFGHENFENPTIECFEHN